MSVMCPVFAIGWDRMRHQQPPDGPHIPSISSPTTVVDISPSASRLTESLRDIGYDFNGAIADLVDNSIAAGATQVTITSGYAAEESWIRVCDNGSGMTPTAIDEALRFGTRRKYAAHELGRFGLGLKTASLSQCRQLTVVSRAAEHRRVIHSRQLDLDHIASADRWEVHRLHNGSVPLGVIDHLQTGSGTVILWRKLDRVFGSIRPDGGWARRRLERLLGGLHLHLGMVFHRFISGSIDGGKRLEITVNGTTVDAWDPFAHDEVDTIELSTRTIDVTTDLGHGRVTFRPYVLPHRSAFSSAEAFERMAGPRKWNRQQGLYVYRGERLVHHGGWSGLRAIDEHTKYARASLDFSPELDDAFRVNVAKMRISIPPEVRTQLTTPVSELCQAAMARYRRGELSTADQPVEIERHRGLGETGLIIKAAAIQTGQLVALDRIAASLVETAPGLAEALGWKASLH